MAKTLTTMLREADALVLQHRASYVLARQAIGVANRARTREARSAAFIAYNDMIRSLRAVEARVRELLHTLGPIQLQLFPKL